MEYNIKGKITLKDHKDFNKAHFFHDPLSLLVCGILFCLIIFFNVKHILHKPTLENILSTFVPVIVIFLLCYTIYAISRNRRYNSDNTLKEELSMTLSENGIAVASQRGSYNYKIEDFRKIVFDKKLIAIYISTKSAILIPRHFFSSKEEEKEVEAFIKENYIQAK